MQDLLNITQTFEWKIGGFYSLVVQAYRLKTLREFFTDQYGETIAKDFALRELVMKFAEKLGNSSLESDMRSIKDLTNYDGHNEILNCWLINRNNVDEYAKIYLTKDVIEVLDMDKYFKKLQNQFTTIHIEYNGKTYPLVLTTTKKD